MVMKTDAQYRIRKILLTDYLTNKLGLSQGDRLYMESLIDEIVLKFMEE